MGLEEIRSELLKSFPEDCEDCPFPNCLAKEDFIIQSKAGWPLEFPILSSSVQAEAVGQLAYKNDFPGVRRVLVPGGKPGEPAQIVTECGDIRFLRNLSGNLGKYVTIRENVPDFTPEMFEPDSKGQEQ